MKKSEYQQIIDRILKPKLVALGFKEVKLKDCMKPEVLYRNNNLWFSTSWDWRDRYLDIDLGRLHWFKDVMPRFIVIGDYSSYSNEIVKIKESDEDYLEKVVIAIANTIENAIAIYNERYDQNVTIYIEKINKYSTVFKSHLGSEVRDEELADYKA
jgi:hypothetical protein